jgi:hypothetical protein
MNQFLEVGTKVYENDPVWVRQSEDIFLQKFKAAKSQQRIRIWPFIAIENGSPIARGAAIFDKRVQDESARPQGWIGFFESLRDHQEAATTVLQRCEDRLRMAGVKSVLAPKVDDMTLGLLIKGFGLPQTVLTNHNPPFYFEVFQQYGYQVKTRILTFYFTRETVKQRSTRRTTFRTREVSRSNFSKEVLILNKLHNSIFGNRDGRALRTLEEYQELVQSFISFLDNELVIVAEDSRGDPVGILICLPDVYQSFKGEKIDRARIVSIGVLPGVRKGVGGLMGIHLMANLLKKGYQIAEGSWILKNNIPPQVLAKRFGATPGKEFVLLRKEL